MRTRGGLGSLLAFCACALAPTALGESSFFVTITTASAPSYSHTIDVLAWASYHAACPEMTRCDQNVVGEFELRRGPSAYSPLVARAVDETGQNSSSLNAAFRIPSCRLMARNRRQAYTVVLNARAPDGQRRTTSQTLYVRSCR